MRRGSLKSLSFHPEGIFGKGEFFKSSPTIGKLLRSIDFTVSINRYLNLNRTLLIVNDGLTCDIGKSGKVSDT